MALGDANRDVVFFWCGALTGDRLDRAEELFDRFGSPYAVAYQLLNEQLGGFSMEVADIASASDRANHTRNMDALRQRIGRLVETVLSDPAIVLTGAALTLFDQAATSAERKLVSVPIQYRNDRVT